MVDKGKVLYEIWVAKMARNAIDVTDEWDQLSQLDQQAWSETADEFFNWCRS